MSALHQPSQKNSRTRAASALWSFSNTIMYCIIYIMYFWNLDTSFIITCSIKENNSDYINSLTYLLLCTTASLCVVIVHMCNWQKHGFNQKLVLHPCLSACVISNLQALCMSLDLRPLGSVLANKILHACTDVIYRCATLCFKYCVLQHFTQMLLICSYCTCINSTMQYQYTLLWIPYDNNSYCVLVTWGDKLSEVG